MKKNNAKSLARLFISPNVTALSILVFATLAMFGIPVMWLVGILTSFTLLERDAKFIAPVVFALFLPAVIIFLFMSEMIVWQLFWQVVLFLAMVVVLSLVLKKYASWTQVLTFAGGMGLVAIILLYSIYPDIDNWWVERISAFFDPSDLPDIQVDITAYAKYASGVQAVMVMVSSIINVLIARFWQAGVYSKYKKAKEEAMQARSSYGILLMILLSLVAAVMQINWGIDALIIVLAPMFFVGVSVFHYWLNNHHKSSNKMLPAVVFYLFNFMLFPYATIFTIAMGMVDLFFNVRDRLCVVSK